jgi:L-rhamnose mutarotase
MKAFALIFCFVVLHAFRSVGQTSGSNQKLSSIIDSLYVADQNTAKIRPSDSAAATFQRVIRRNFPAVKRILDTYGYPNYTMVGQESSNHYFTLVQHSDFNQDFQQRVLKIMRQEVHNKNASGKQYAFLTDRIAITKGEPQVYGTQLLMSGNSKVKPCIAPSKLNKRRKSVGLEPIEDYLKKSNELFYEMNPQQRNKPVTN